jgi:hypothetical protein
MTKRSCTDNKNTYYEGKACGYNKYVIANKLQTWHALISRPKMILETLFGNAIELWAACILIIVNQSSSILAELQ